GSATVAVTEVSGAWTGSATEARRATAPAGGHGSPPGVRGRPRRRAGPSSVATDAAVRAVATTAVAASPLRFVSVASRPRGATGEESSAAAAAGAVADDTTAAAPAGGQGSPPGVRGRPRRSACEAAGAEAGAVPELVEGPAGAGAGGAASDTAATAS